jgi:hypothetical protein
LSPLLYVLAGDLLHSVINRAYHVNLINHSLSRDFGQDFPIVQYVVDILIIVPTEAVQLITLKDLLRTFSDSTGL